MDGTRVGDGNHGPVINFSLPTFYLLGVFSLSSLCYSTLTMGNYLRNIMARQTSWSGLLSTSITGMHLLLSCGICWTTFFACILTCLLFFCSYIGRSCCSHCCRHCSSSLHHNMVIFRFYKWFFLSICILGNGCFSEIHEPSISSLVVLLIAIQGW